jgi:hypothetical protein
METKLEALSIIKDELLMDKTVDARVVINAAKLAEEDNYLYELLIDWMKVTDENIKDMLRDEVINYTEEVLRKMKIRNEL